MYFFVVRSVASSRSASRTASLRAASLFAAPTISLTSIAIGKHSFSADERLQPVASIALRASLAILIPVFRHVRHAALRAPYTRTLQRVLFLAAPTQRTQIPARTSRARREPVRVPRVYPLCGRRNSPWYRPGGSSPLRELQLCDSGPRPVDGKLNEFLRCQRRRFQQQPPRLITVRCTIHSSGDSVEFLHPALVAVPLLKTWFANPRHPFFVSAFQRYQPAGDITRRLMHRQHAHEDFHPAPFGGARSASVVFNSSGNATSSAALRTTRRPSANVTTYTSTCSPSGKLNDSVGGFSGIDDSLLSRN